MRTNRWLALVVITALLVYLTWKITEPFFQVLILAVALAMVFWPTRQRLMSLTGRRENVSALIATLIALVVIVVPFVFVAVVLVGELPGAVDATSKGFVGLKEKWDSASAGSGWLADLRKSSQMDTWLTQEKVQEFASTASSGIAKGAVSIVGGLLGFVFQFVCLLFVLFFVFRDGEKLGARFMEFLPLPEQRATQLITRFDEVLKASVYGVLMVAAVQGICGGLTFWMLGLPSPVIWGVVMMFLCSLPIVGAWVVWMPASLGLFISGENVKGVILLLAGQFIISSIDGFIRPILVGQRARLHEIAIFVSVLGGLKCFGILGILLGPIIFALTMTLVEMLFQSKNPLVETKKA